METQEFRQAFEKFMLGEQRAAAQEPGGFHKVNRIDSARKLFMELSDEQADRFQAILQAATDAANERAEARAKADAEDANWP